VKRKRSWPILMYCPNMWLEGLRRAKQYLARYSNTVSYVIDIYMQVITMAAKQCQILRL